MASIPPPREVVASLISSISLSEQHSAEDATSNPLRDATQDTQKALLTLHVLFPNELLPALDLLDRSLITRLKVHHEVQQHQADANTHLRPGNRDRDESLQRLPPEQFRQLSGLSSVRKNGREDLTGMGPLQASAQRSLLHVLPHSRDQILLRQDQELHHERANAEYAADSRHAQVYLVRSGQLPARVRAVSQPVTMYEVRLDAWNCSCPAFVFSAFPAVKSETHTVPDVASHQRPHPTPSWTFGGLTLGNDIPVCKHLLACVLVEHTSAFANFVEEREVSIDELAGWAAGWGD